MSIAISRLDIDDFIEIRDDDENEGLKKNGGEKVWRHCLFRESYEPCVKRMPGARLVLRLEVCGLIWILLFFI